MSARETSNHDFREAVNGGLYPNFPTGSAYAEYSEAVRAYAEAYEASGSRIGAYERTDCPQQLTVNLKQECGDTLYYLDHLELPSFELAMPLPRASGHECLTDRTAASSDMFSYETQPVLGFNGAVSGPPSVDSYSLLRMYNDTPSGSDSSISIKSEPDGIYSSPDATGIISTNPIAEQDHLDYGSWFSYGSPCFSADGLPSTGPEKWQAQVKPTSDWSQQRAVAPEGIISPQLLSLCVSPPIPKPSIGSFATSSKLSETSHSFRNVDRAPRLAVRSAAPETTQVQTIVNDMSECRIQTVASQLTQVYGAANKIFSHTVLSETPQRFSIQKSPSCMLDPAGRVLRIRRKLPSAPKGISYASVPVKNVRVSSKVEKKRPSPARSAVQSRKIYKLQSPIPQAHKSGRKPSTPRVSSVSVEVEGENKQEQMPAVHAQDPMCKLTAEEIEKILQQRREAKDKFLIDMRKEGMSYKAIRTEGGFSEAESTLRGRVRSLTKPKDERVRKPIWQHNDDRILKEAVHMIADDPYSSKKKIPWKDVSDYIAKNGGSYKFGNSTCKKRWETLSFESRDEEVSE